MICISRTNTRTIPVPTSADQACWNPRRGRNGNEISSVAATMEPRPSDGQDLWISGCVRYVDVYYQYGIHIIHWPSPTCISGLRGWGAKNIKNSCLMLSLFFLIVPVFFRWFSGGLSKCPFLFSEWPFTSPLSSQHHPPSLRATIAASMECWMPWMTTVEWWNAPSMGTVTSCWKTCPLAERDGGGRWPNRIQYRYTIWLFNIAMGNDPFIDGLPIKNGDFPWLC